MLTVCIANSLIKTMRIEAISRQQTERHAKLHRFIHSLQTGASAKDRSAAKVILIDQSHCPSEVLVFQFCQARFVLLLFVTMLVVVRIHRRIWASSAIPDPARRKVAPE